MIEVIVCFLCFSTVVHTLETQGQVVSTMWQPRLVEQLHFLNGGAEGGKDHHITGGDAGEILDALVQRE